MTISLVPRLKKCILTNESTHTGQSRICRRYIGDVLILGVKSLVFRETLHGMALQKARGKVSLEVVLVTIIFTPKYEDWQSHCYS